MLSLNYYPGGVGGWVGGWVGGSNGNKANLSPARAGTGLSLATRAFPNHVNQFISIDIHYMNARKGNAIKYNK